MSDSLRPPGIVHGILPARILEWVAVPSRGSSQPRSPALQAMLYQLSHQGSPNITGKRMRSLCMCCHFSRVQLFATSWTVARQAPLSMGFSRHEYWSGLPFPSPGDLPDPGIKPASLSLAGGFFTTSATWEARC